MKFLSDLDELAGVLYIIEKMFGQVIWVNEITHERANITFKAFQPINIEHYTIKRFMSFSFN